jgi:hypothetical protein
MKSKDMSSQAELYLRSVTQADLNALQALKDLSEDFTDLTIMLIDRRIEALDRENEAQQRNYDEAKSREQELIELRKEVSATGDAVPFNYIALSEEFPQIMNHIYST